MDARTAACIRGMNGDSSVLAARSVRRSQGLADSSVNVTIGFDGMRGIDAGVMESLCAAGTRSQQPSLQVQGLVLIPVEQEHRL